MQNNKIYKLYIKIYRAWRKQKIFQIKFEINLRKFYENLNDVNFH